MRTGGAVSESAVASSSTAKRALSPSVSVLCATWSARMVSEALSIATCTRSRLRPRLGTAIFTLVPRRSPSHCSMSWPSVTALGTTISPGTMPPSP
jgi:hypothetical protein